jgi:hypothetical protein
MAVIVKSFFFVFIGAMLTPPWLLILFGVLLGVALYLMRVPSVNLALLGTSLTKPEKKLVAVSLPRGMAAGVLATLPVSAGIPGTGDLPVAVFACVFTTILIFAVRFPAARRAITPAAGLPEIAMPAGAARPEAAGADAAGAVTTGGGAAEIGGGMEEPKG